MQQNSDDKNDRVISALREENSKLRDCILAAQHEHDKQKQIIDTLENAIKIHEQRLQAAMEQLSSTVAHVNTLQSRIRSRIRKMSCVAEEDE